jgi:DNA-binding NarL/FixJ family response regulator
MSARKLSWPDLVILRGPTRGDLVKADRSCLLAIGQGNGSRNQPMSSESIRCVLLADQHHGLSEGVRRLLESEFEAVVMVANEISLMETVTRLQPNMVVADLELAKGERFEWVRRLLARCPQSPVIVLSSHEGPTVTQTALSAGAAGFVLKRDIASQLLDAVDEVLAGRRYVPDDSSHNSEVHIKEALPGIHHESC